MNFIIEDTIQQYETLQRNHVSIREATLLSTADILDGCGLFS